MSAAAQGLVRLPVWRARVVLAVFVAAFAVLAARSVYLQAMQTQFLQEKGEARYSRVLEVPGTRGRILDRNGEALAISTPVQSVWAIPGDVQASAAQLRKLGALLGLEARELRASEMPQPTLKLLGRAIKPSREEIERNPRARSATLRVAERSAAPYDPVHHRIEPGARWRN